MKATRGVPSFPAKLRLDVEQGWRRRMRPTGGLQEPGGQNPLQEEPVRQVEGAPETGGKLLRRYRQDPWGHGFGSAQRWLERND